MTRAISRLLAALALATILGASGASSQAAPTTGGPTVVRPMDFRMGPGCGASAG